MVLEEQPPLAIPVPTQGMPKAAGFVVESGQTRSISPGPRGVMTVRGNGTLNLASEGLYVLDGLILESGFVSTRVTSSSTSKRAGSLSRAPRSSCGGRSWGPKGTCSSASRSPAPCPSGRHSPEPCGRPTPKLPSRIRPCRRISSGRSSPGVLSFTRAYSGSTCHLHGSGYRRVSRIRPAQGRAQPMARLKRSLGLAILMVAGLGCGSEPECLAACENSVTFELMRPVSGRLVRIALEPGESFTCTRRESGPTQYECSPWTGGTSMEVGPDASIWSITWDHVSPGSYRFQIEVDGALEVDQALTHAPRKAETLCGVTCKESVRVSVP